MMPNFGTHCTSSKYFLLILSLAINSDHWLYMNCNETNKSNIFFLFYKGRYWGYIFEFKKDSHGLLRSCFQLACDLKAAVCSLLP